MPLELQIIILASVSFIMGIFSGIAGGGAGMVMIPLAVAVGLPPQTAVGTMKLAGLGAAFGGLSVFAKSGHIRRDILKVMIPIAIVIGVATPFIFQRISSETFQTMLGIILLLMAPTLLIKRAQLKPSRRKKGLGYLLYAVAMMIVALFGAGAGMLASFILTLLLGTTKIEANATKRAVTACMVPITFVGLLLTGYVSLWHGIPLLVSGFIGTHIGSKIALKKGEEFVTYSMVILSVMSGIWLLLS